MLYKTLQKVCLLCFICMADTAFGDTVGNAVGVKQNAFVERNGRRSDLKQGQGIYLGDVITTGATGQVQVLFQDETRIAIGKNSHLVVESILFDSPDTASEFTVSAVKGAFRFLSGNSEKSSYSLRTPNGTMGIRGTEFDFVVSPVD